MRNNLPYIPYKNERAIVNLDHSRNDGTHWCAYIKENKIVYWFDPFGDVSPPTEILKYFTNCNIFYNFDKYQYFGTTNCGKLCLEFLATYKRKWILTVYVSMAQTFTLTGTQSEISVNYHPPIELNPNSFYKLGLVGFYTYNSIPNIDRYNNKFYCSAEKSVLVQDGVYTIDQIETKLQLLLKKDVISLKYNVNNKTCELRSPYKIDFNKNNSLGKLLGFQEKIYEADVTHSVNLKSNQITVKNTTSYNFAIFREIILDIGIYQISDIEKILKNILGDSHISLKINNNTQKCVFTSSFDIDFERDNTFHRLLGFSKNIYKSKLHHISDLPVQALKVVTINIECSITSGSYRNSETGHSIYEFGINVDPGYAITEEPNNIIYYPLTTRTISNITLKIVDQNGDLINFREEPIVIRLELKEWV